VERTPSHTRSAGKRCKAPSDPKGPTGSGTAPRPRTEQARRRPASGPRSGGAATPGRRPVPCVPILFPPAASAFAPGQTKAPCYRGFLGVGGTGLEPVTPSLSSQTACRGGLAPARMNAGIPVPRAIPADAGYGQIRVVSGGFGQNPHSFCPISPCPSDSGRAASSAAH
jgi:hypothetical protein